MKILYGVQGTGNGHLSRAMAMAAALKEYPDIEITWLLSGREKGRQYKGINEYHWREGLTLVTDNGRVSLTKTFKKNKVRQLLRDIRDLNLKDYDRVLCDFEPVVAHAARRQGIPTWGISHQCSFDYNIPTRGTNFISSAIMKSFAPVTHGIGLHWHHFDQAILPPILHIEKPDSENVVQANKIIVYLPMENAEHVIELLKPLKNYEFFFYHPDNTDRDEEHIHVRAISIDGFKHDLQTAHAIICNSGFELISECLYMGKSVLAKPLKGQMEQLSNAQALHELGYATVINEITTAELERWLSSNPAAIELPYPNVAARLAKWIAEDCKESTADLAKDLWKGVEPIRR